MHKLRSLLANNKQWSDKINDQDPTFFQRLSEAQAPEYLWIGCSDSRVPANQIVGLLPGEIFVHRNIANIVIHTDFNCMSVIEYAVEVLKVKHIIVCGHYGCGGVKAAIENTSHGLIDNWLYNIKTLYFRKRKELETITDETERLNKLCELNVEYQVRNVANAHVVQRAWRNGQELTVHGWVYSLKNGMVTDLNMDIYSPDALPDEFRVSDGQ